MTPCSSRTAKTLGAAIVGAALALAALGAAQPSATATQPSAVSPSSPPAPPPVWEYGALSRTTSTGAGTTGARGADWRFCSPGEDLVGEEGVMARYGGR